MKKIKLRDITPEQEEELRDMICTADIYGYGDTECKGDECPFSMFCDGIGGWVYHKDMYSDKFLDQEIEVEE